MAYLLHQGFVEVLRLVPKLVESARSDFTQHETGALLIAATLVAAIKLCGERIDNSLKVHYAISESIQLAHGLGKDSILDFKPEVSKCFTSSLREETTT